MNHPQKVLITCLVLLLFLLGAGAQVPSVSVITPVHGYFALPNRNANIVDHLISVDTFTGAIETLLTNDPLVEAPRWSPNGEYLVFHRGPRPGSDNQNVLLDLQTGQGRSITTLQDRATIPIGWSRDGTNILYSNYRLDLTTYPYLPSYSFKIYDLVSETVNPIAELHSLQILPGLPRQQGVGDFIVTVDNIYRIVRNPIYDEWIAFTDIGLDAAILPDGTFPDEYPPEEAVLHDVILWNTVTGQLFSADVLIADKIEIGQPIAWSADGEYLFVSAGSRVYILSLQTTGSDWQLNVVTSAEVRRQSATFWLGAGDLLITFDVDDTTDERVFYIGEIVKGQWYSTEFIRLSSEIYAGSSPGDWRLDATSTEKQALTCLFDQALLSRLSTSSQARVISSSLDVWAEPTFEGTPITQLSNGTEIAVIGSTACVNAVDYYRLWQVQSTDGTIGWAAEADTTEYFLEPVTTSQSVSLTITTPPTDGTTLVPPTMAAGSGGH
ncbi:MAG: hypothetical protein K8I60_12625 [Anaerolineae bacterium]|nr:hypothetical protein [Anaerolineae bacterium]